MSLPPPAYQPPYTPPIGPKQNQKALWAMILGMVSLPFILCCGLIGLPLAIAAITLGILGRSEIGKSGGTQTGAGMALTGIITGAVQIVASILLFVLGFALHMSGTSDGLVKPPF